MEQHNLESLKKLIELEEAASGGGGGDDSTSFDYYMESSLINLFSPSTFNTTATTTTTIERVSIQGIISRFIIHFIKGVSFGSGVFFTNLFINSK